MGYRIDFILAVIDKKILLRSRLREVDGPGSWNSGRDPCEVHLYIEAGSRSASRLSDTNRMAPYLEYALLSARRFG